MATIRRRESGKWEARVRRKGGRAASRTFSTKNDAVAWAREQERDIERGVWVDATAAHRLTLEELLADYIKRVAEPRGSEAELSRLARFIEDLGAYRLDQLTPQLLLEWRDERLRAVAPGTVARELSVLGGAMGWAMKERLIPLPRNPVSAISRPVVADARKRRLEKDEEARLLAAMVRRAIPGSGKVRTGNYQGGARQSLLRPVFEFALETAMRQGEILALDWAHVELDGQTAHLPRTKNGQARTVPLSKRATEILRERRQAAAAAQKGVAPSRGPAFPLSTEALKQAWARTVKRARSAYESECAESGQEPDRRLLDLRFHDLRHEATSRLAEKLTNVIELAAVTGHKDIRMLQRYYHPRASELAKKLG